MRIASFILCVCVAFLSACSSHISKQAQEVYSDNANAPFRIYFSVRTNTVKDDVQEAHRLTGILWGNTPEHVRVDLSAGIGALIARALETDSTLSIHIPQEKKLYVYSATHGNIGTIFGVKIPFNLRELTKIALCQAESTSLQQYNKDGWTTDLTYKENRPFRLSAHYTDGTSVIITLKKIEYTEPFTSNQLLLAPPDGTAILCHP